MIPRWRNSGMALMAFIAAASAEFSPLSILSQGYGLPLEAMGARERGMGDAGMASLSTLGYYLPNASRSAYFDRTSFVATLEGDMDYLQDHSTSNRLMTYAVPTLATAIKTRKIGTFGLHYQQTYERHYDLVQPAATPTDAEQQYTAEGGLYLLGFSWGYSPIPLLAFGVSEDFVLGRDRFINAAVFNAGQLPLESENLTGDTTETRYQGSYPTLSMTVHTHWVDAAVAYTPSVDITAHTDRSVTGLMTNETSSATRTLPFTFASGLAWRPSPRQTVALDFTTEAWSGDTLLNRSYKTCMGYEFRGSSNPFEDYYKRMAYRAGLGQNVLYLQEIQEFYGTLGLGFPLGPRGHVLDVSMRYGHKSGNGDTFFAEDDVKISASVVGVGVWGQPVRQRH